MENKTENKVTKLNKLSAMKKGELLLECQKQRSLLKRTAAHIKKVESENEFYKGISRSAELYILYLMDLVNHELDAPEDHELEIPKADLSELLKTKVLTWKESEDQKSVILKIQNKKEESDNVSGDHTNTTEDQKEQSGDPIQEDKK